MTPLLEKFLLAIGWHSPYSGPTNRFINRNHLPENWRGNLSAYWLTPQEDQLVVPPDYLDDRRLPEVLRIARDLEQMNWGLECSHKEYRVRRGDYLTSSCGTPQEALIRFIIQGKAK